MVSVKKLKKQRHQALFIYLHANRRIRPVSEIYSMRVRIRNTRDLRQYASNAHTHVFQREPKLKTNGQKTSTISVLGEYFQEMGIRKESNSELSIPRRMVKGACDGFYVSVQYF